MSTLSILGPHVRGRMCGTCTACCTQVPVVLGPAEQKPANTRCRHLRSKGCGIYKNRPAPCQFWSCRWLFDPDTAELRRPDHSGVVIDPTPDTVLIQHEEGEEREPAQCVQLWVDPARRDAHRDPALRAYLERFTLEHQMLVIVRWSSAEAMVLLPPWSNTEGVWIEHGSSLNSAEVNAAKLASGNPVSIGQVLTDARIAAIRAAEGR